MARWLRVFRIAQLLDMVMGEAHRRIREQDGQTHAWHAAAAWHGHAQDWRLFSPGAPEGC